MADFTIKKGFDVRLEGPPARELVDGPDSATVSIYPRDNAGLKQRLLVREGEAVERGTPLIEDKRNSFFKLCAPAAGTVARIERGDRRLIEEIVIEVSRDDKAVAFKGFSADKVATAGRRVILDQLQATGYLALIRQRPFSRMANPAKRPKSIFVNAMNTAPFEADAGVAAGDDPAGFQAGLDLLAQLTEGKVHVCVGPDAAAVLTGAQRVEVHTFRGPHPAGNSSVHISRVDPMRKTDIVWTVKAADVPLIGRLFLDGALPRRRVIALGGHGVRPEARRHYRVRMGARLEGLLKDNVQPGEMRYIRGNILAGATTSAKGALHLDQSAVTVIPEGRNREFMGWLAPGLDRLSYMRTYLSTWLARGRAWPLHTNKNGGIRAMVLTGLYDRVMPLNIMVDFLVRAVIAGDTEEAIKLGILETDPEDFALCDFVCPCKTEIQELIRRGLEQIEAEGI